MLENAKGARLLTCYAAFKAQENRRFSISYTVSHFIGDKILAHYTHEAYKK